MKSRKRTPKERLITGGNILSLMEKNTINFSGYLP